MKKNKITGLYILTEEEYKEIVENLGLDSETEEDPFE